MQMWQEDGEQPGRRFYTCDLEALSQLPVSEVAALLEHLTGYLQAPKVLREPEPLTDVQAAELRRLLHGMILTIPEAPPPFVIEGDDDCTRRSFVEGCQVRVLMHETAGRDGQGEACIAAVDMRSDSFRSLRGISISLIGADESVVDGQSSDGVLFFRRLLNGAKYTLYYGEAATPEAAE